MPKQKWITVLTHRSYEIQINQYPSPLFPHGIGYRINDPAFNNLYNSVDEAIQAIDTATGCA